MKARAVKARASDAYLAMIQDFPLTPIRDEDHLDEALAVLDRGLRLDPDEGREQYLDALAILVRSYEDRRHPKVADATDSDVLRELMRANGLSATKLAAAAGVSRVAISAVLKGSRALSRDQVVNLSRYFGVPPAVFLPG